MSQSQNTRSQDPRADAIVVQQRRINHSLEAQNKVLRDDNDMLRAMLKRQTSELRDEFHTFRKQVDADRDADRSRIHQLEVLNTNLVVNTAAALRNIEAAVLGARRLDNLDSPETMTEEAPPDVQTTPKAEPQQQDSETEAGSPQPPPHKRPRI